ncbi:hypothetical protein FHS21_006325 [Phyllobacterium trifolii]|uniref:Copper chaperone PCu(A)C n=1 Tax=Phyllobacterium trifolii TaxID=300193 RepID=A0A839UFD1_9HYPH|nr:copper chaperone PCu(A)C [Phyllobacterium trifolii]MBB3149868.1 hypothetical protein [Phyllobacterium trifolii]
MNENIRRSTVLAGAALILATGGAEAHSYKLGSIAIGHLWTKPSGSGELDIFGPLFNTGSVPDRLISAASPIANEVEFVTEVDGGEQPLGRIELPPGKPVSLASWGAHIALKKLKGNPREGDMVSLTLKFEKAGTIDVEAAVEKLPSPE